MTKLLLHTCCGPCFLGVWEEINDKFEVSNLFFNPNIQPKEEYQVRLNNLKKVVQGKSKNFIELGYNKKEHQQAILGLENKFPSRCLKCYELRLERTAQEAKKRGFTLFSTTLLVSPYQKQESIKEIGKRVAAENKVEFYYFDWRSYFRLGQQRAKELNIYRQKYCGCQLSKTEQINTGKSQV